MFKIILIMFAVVGFITAPLLVLRRQAQVEIRRRQELVKAWQDILSKRPAPFIEFRDDNAIVMWQPPGASGYVVAHYVCDRRGRSYEVASLSQCPYDTAFDVFNTWVDELQSGARYTSGLRYPPYNKD